MIDYKKQGKRNQDKGRRFESKVRADLEDKGFICSKWQNNVELKSKFVNGLKERTGISDKTAQMYLNDSGKLVPAKSGRFRRLSTGFPDFIIFRPHVQGEMMLSQKWFNGVVPMEVFGAECKSNGYLSKEEKEKCQWLLDENIFSKILIASRDKSKKGSIVYKEYETKEE